MAYKVKDLDGKPILLNGAQIMAQDSFETRIEDYSNKERSFLAVASAESPDRTGDEISVKGWKLEDYRKNPVVMPFHDYHTLPVGRSLEEFTKRKRLMFRPQFAAYPESMRMYEMYRDKYLKGFSVGFVAIKSEPIPQEGEDEDIMSCFGPLRFLEQNLLEVSVAPVPAHQDALAEIKSMVKKGELYIPARYLEDAKDIQIEEYNNCIHAIVNDRSKFSKLFVMDFENVKLVYGPYRGEDAKENHIYSFIFLEIEGLEDDYIETFVKEKREERIEFTGDTEYKEEEFTQKETVLITLLPEADEKLFVEHVELKLEEGDDPGGGYLIPEDVSKPYPNEHACRLKEPGDFDEFKRGTRKHEGKEYSVIYGIKDGKSEDQAYRYNKDTWTAAEAKSHCATHDGTFEEASGKVEPESRVATFKYCVCEPCGYSQDHVAGKPCQDEKCPECGKDLKGSNEKPEKPAKEVDISVGKDVGERIFVLTVDETIDETVLTTVREELKEKLPKEAKLVILSKGMILTCIGEDQIKDISIEDKIGAVLSKANKEKLEKAIALIMEVIELADKEEGNSSDDKGAETIIKIIEDKIEPEPQGDSIEGKVNLPVTSKEELTEMVLAAVKSSLGKLE